MGKLKKKEYDDSNSKDYLLRFVRPVLSLSPQNLFTKWERGLASIVEFYFP